MNFFDEQSGPTGASTSGVQYGAGASGGLEDAFDPALAGVGMQQTSGAEDAQDGNNASSSGSALHSTIHNEGETSMEDSFAGLGSAGPAASGSGSRMPPRSTSMQASTSSNGKSGQSKPHVLQVRCLVQFCCLWLTLLFDRRSIPRYPSTR